MLSSKYSLQGSKIDFNMMMRDERPNLNISYTGHRVTLKESEIGNCDQFRVRSHCTITTANANDSLMSDDFVCECIIENARNPR